MLPDQFPAAILNSTEIAPLQNKELFEQFAAYINNLIKSDFEQLVQLLYRIDVDERKLKKLLSDQPHVDAGELIATLIIDRQVQKIKSRQENSREMHEDNDAETW